MEEFEFKQIDDSKVLMKKTKMKLIELLDRGCAIIKNQRVEIKDLRHELDVQINSYDKIIRKLNNAEEKIVELRNQNDKLKEAIEVLENNNDTLHKNYIALSKERENDEATVVQYKNQLEISKKKYNELADFNKTIVDDNNQLNAKIDDEKKIQFIMAITIVISVILCITFAVF